MLVILTCMIEQKYLLVLYIYINETYAYIQIITIICLLQPYDT